MHLSEGLNEWSTLLGQENIVTEPRALQSVQTATFATSQKVLGILFPDTSDDVAAIVEIANRYEIPLYPVSGGQNWGYGSRVPAGNDCVLLNLKRLNRILDFSEELAYVTIEPGVTQKQLYEFLRERGSRLWMDATGGGLESSIVGNVVERGFGHSPYGDRFSRVCGLEVILPTGERVHTGMGRFGNARSTPTYRWGIGPYLDGLFSQSNLGIVTRMTFWLQPSPEYFEVFSFGIRSDERLPALIDALRPLRLDGTLKSAIHLGNCYRLLSSLGQYPWERTGGKTPLSPEALAQIADARGLQAWSGYGGLYGTRQQVKSDRARLKKALKGKVDRLIFLDERLFSLAERFATPYRWATGVNLAEMLKVFKPVYRLLQGVPTSDFLASAYWRKRGPVPKEADPDRDGCGLIWCSPVAPLEGQHAARIYQMATEIIFKGGFEPLVTMTLLTERCLGCVLSISYDREIPGEDERAMDCYRELLEQLAVEGYYPYRLGIQSMDWMRRGEKSYGTLLRELKKVLDPRGILAPDRYCLEEK